MWPTSPSIGAIIAIGERLQAQYDAARVVDARDQYVIPGLADMHTHGTGVRPPDQDDTEPVLARFLYYGVTTVLNLGSFQAWPARIDSLRAEMNKGTLEGPRLLAVGALITVPGSHPTTTIYFCISVPSCPIPFQSAWSHRSRIGTG